MLGWETDLQYYLSIFGFAFLYGKIFHVFVYLRLPTLKFLVEIVERQILVLSPFWIPEKHVFYFVFV